MAFTFEPTGLVLLFHILFAALWFGGAVFNVRLMGPALMQAGPNGMGFVLALAKRRGIGWYFALTGLLTIVFGAWMYGLDKVYTAPFDGGNLWLTLGATLAVLTYLHGVAAILPTERKWLAVCNAVQGTPSPQQGQEIATLGAKLGRNSAISAAMLGLTILLMLLHEVLM